MVGFDRRDVDVQTVDEAVRVVEVGAGQAGMFDRLGEHPVDVEIDGE